MRELGGRAGTTMATRPFAVFTMSRPTTASAPATAFARLAAAVLVDAVAETATSSPCCTRACTDVRSSSVGMPLVAVARVRTCVVRARRESVEASAGVGRGHGEECRCRPVARRLGQRDGDGHGHADDDDAEREPPLIAQHSSLASAVVLFGVPGAQWVHDVTYTDSESP